MADDVTNANCAIARATKSGNRAAERRARQDLAEALIAKRITTALAGAPRLRPEQRASLIGMLTSNGQTP
jgi:hypothetical protein